MVSYFKQYFKWLHQKVIAFQKEKWYLWKHVWLHVKVSSPCLHREPRHFLLNRQMGVGGGWRTDAIINHRPSLSQLLSLQGTGKYKWAVNGTNGLSWYLLSEQYVSPNTVKTAGICRHIVAGLQMPFLVHMYLLLCRLLMPVTQVMWTKMIRNPREYPLKCMDQHPFQTLPFILERPSLTQCRKDLWEGMQNTNSRVR